MDILEESRMMLELAINSLQRAGHYTEQFERTVAKIKQEQVKKLNIDDVSKPLDPEIQKSLNDFSKTQGTKEPIKKRF